MVDLVKLKVKRCCFGLNHSALCRKNTANKGALK